MSNISNAIFYSVLSGIFGIGASIMVYKRVMSIPEVLKGARRIGAWGGYPIMQAEGEGGS